MPARPIVLRDNDKKALPAYQQGSESRNDRIPHSLAGGSASDQNNYAL
jgi:hypothetical protein